MTYQLAPTTVAKFFDANGNPLALGLVYTYQAGTTTPQVSYQSSTGPANTNPIVLNSRGECALWLDPTLNYKINVTDLLGNQMQGWPVDNVPGGFVATSSLGPTLYPESEAELSAGITIVNPIYPYNNVLRYGIIPNSLAAADQNTIYAKALFNYNITNGPQGTFTFPNLTGADVYYFSDMILFRPGCHLDLNECTLSFSKVGIASDSQGGFIFATQDFSIYNGNVIGTYPNGGTNTFFSLMQFGARDAPVSGSPLPTIFDSLLPNYVASGITMGNIRVKDVYLNFNNPNANVVTYFGGVNEVAFENVFIEGNSQIQQGIYGEFGWATNQANDYQRQTSHPHNHHYKNVHIQNVSTSNTGYGGIVFNGGYNITIDGMHLTSMPLGCSFGSGESLFFQPWVGVDDIGSIIPNGRTIHLRNIVGRQITEHGIDITGNSLASGGYLSGHITGIQDEVDQLNCTVESVSMDGVAGAGGYGIISSAGIQTIKNSKFTNFQRGVVIVSDCTFYDITGVTCLNNSSFGIQIGQGGNGAFSPARLSAGSIRDCFIAGSGTNGSNSAAIAAANTISMLVEASRFGYETAHDNQSETVQTNAVNIGSTCSGVICRANYVAATTGGAVAYAQVGATGSQGCVIDNAQGVATFSGNWEGVEQSWTPVLTCVTVGNLSVTYSVQAGGYIKKGKVIDFWYQIATSAFTHTTSSGNVNITGFPYTSSSTSNETHTHALSWSGITKANYTNIVGQIGVSTQVATLTGSGSGQTFATILITDMPTAGTVVLEGNGTYYTS